MNAMDILIPLHFFCDAPNSIHECFLYLPQSKIDKGVLRHINSFFLPKIRNTLDSQ